MSKNKKLIIIILGIIALLMVILTAVILIPNGRDTGRSDGNELLLFDKQGLIPEDITIKNDSGEFELLGYVISEPESESGSEPDDDTSDTVSGGSDTDNSDSSPAESADVSEESHTLKNGTDIVYTMQEHPAYNLDKELSDSIASGCVSLYASQIIDKSGTRYAEYGLDEPAANVSIRYSDATVIKLSIGDFAPDHMGVYIMLDGDKNVYLAAVSDTECFFLDWMQLFDKKMTGSIDEVTDIILSGTDIDGEFSITENTHGCYPVKFITDDETRVPCDDTAARLVYESVDDLKADRVAAIDVSPADLAEYGLDKPFKIINVKGKGGQSIKLFASKADDEGNFHIMTENASIVYQLASRNCRWYALNGTELLSSSVFTVRSDELKQLTTVSDNTQQVFDITRKRVVGKNYYESDIITATLNGKEIPYLNIATFLMNVSRIARTDEVPPSTDGFQPLLTLKLSYVNDTDITDTFVIMRNPNGRTIAVLNGSLECCIDNEFADTLIAQTAQIPQSGLLDELQMIVYDNDNSEQ